MMKKHLIAALAVAALALGAIVAQKSDVDLKPARFVDLAVPSAQAAVSNLAISNPGVQYLPFHISGQYTASTTSVVKFNMPMPCDLIGVGATARASGGTSPTLTVDVKLGGTTVLSAPISITAGTWGEGTITTTAITDEGVVTADLAITGTSPTWNDITLLMTCIRK